MLKNCLNCGKPVSDQAPHCPHCNKKHPTDVNYWKEEERKSLEWQREREEREKKEKEEQDRKFQEKISVHKCRECSHPQEKYKWLENPVCPNCGYDQMFLKERRELEELRRKEEDQRFRDEIAQSDFDPPPNKVNDFLHLLFDLAPLIIIILIIIYIANYCK